MGRYWSYEVCGWLESGAPDPLSTPWAGHGLALPGPTGPVSPADLVGLPRPARAPLPEQRSAVVAAPVDV